MVQYTANLHLFNRKDKKKFEKFLIDHDIEYRCYLWRRIYLCSKYHNYKHLIPGVNYFGPRVWKKKKNWISWMRTRNKYVFVITFDDSKILHTINTFLKLEMPKYAM